MVYGEHDDLSGEQRPDGRRLQHHGLPVQARERTPAHVHDREDEFCYVLKGRINAYIGKEVFSAGQNEGVYFPKFVPHTFTILTSQLRMLIWMSPGGFEEYFRDMSEPARSLNLPEHAVNYSAVDMDHAIRKGREHGISLLTPDEIRQQMPPLAKFLAL
jgi:mannose-6-phosphate isomerase-like protein (cupin superfamily)